MSSSEKFKEFAIVLDNPSATFYPGQQVTGHVRINTRKTIKTTGIYVRFLGSCYGSHSKSMIKAHNKPSHYKQHYDSILRHENRDNWAAQSSYVYHTSESEQRKYYKDTEIYFDVREKLWGTDKMEKFEAGAFNLAFQFNLPNNLPTSYEGDRGYVRFVVMANVSRSWNSNYRTMQPFTVISVVDLNNMPGVDKPVSKHEIRKFGFFIFKAGSVTTKIGINKKGYVPGETVILNGEIFNNSMSRISKTVTHLVSVTTYRVSGHVFQSKQDLIQVEGVSIPAKSDWVLKDIHLKIPPAPPSGLGGCGQISVDYHVQVTSVTDLGCVEVSLPIIIGTIPLKTDFVTMQAPPRRPSRRAPPRPPPLNFAALATGPSAPMSSEIQEAANRRLAKEEEALGYYRGDPTLSEEKPTKCADERPADSVDLLTSDIAVVDVAEDNTAPLLEINQITSSAVAQMYPDLPPPSYEECMYGERVNISDDDENDNDDEDNSEDGEIEKVDIPTVQGATASSESHRHRRRRKRHSCSFAPSYVYYHQLNDAGP